jgi:hypothetical protein
MKLITTILGLGLAGLFTLAHGQTLNYAGGASTPSGGSAPTLESFTATPLVFDLGPGTYDVSASFGFTLTAPSGGAATISLPGGVADYMTTTINGVDSGADIGTMSETNNAGGSTIVIPFSAVSGNTLVLTVPTEITMGIATDFDLSPGASASFSESFQIQAAPEPSSVALSVIAFGAFAALVVIRARRSRA